MRLPQTSDQEPQEGHPPPPARRVEYRRRERDEARLVQKGELDRVPADANGGADPEVQLEEAYLTLSALINPDDLERTNEVQAALEQCRAHGRIQVEDDDE